MADLRINPEKLEGFLRRYRPDGTTRDGVGGTTEFMMICPFHPEANPSFHFNLHKGVGHCFACPTKKSYTLEETIAKLQAEATEESCADLKQIRHLMDVIEKKELARKAAEETIDHLIVQREEARKIAEEFRENVSRYDTEIPYIPLPWDPK